jgi:hypothetical protein
MRLSSVKLSILALFVCVVIALSAASAFADAVGVSVFAQSITSVPQVTIDENGDPVLNGEANTIAKEFVTGTMPVNAFSLVPIKNFQQVTYLDVQQKALYTDTATSNINTLSFGQGELRDWINSSSGSTNPSLHGLSESSAAGTIIWNDVLSVPSKGLPEGTPVVLTATYHLAASFTASGDLGNGNGLDGVAFLQDTNTGQIIEFENSIFTPNPVINLTQVQMLNARVGDVLTLQEELVGTLSGNSVYMGSVNASDTSFLNIQDVTAGSSLQSASGINYATVGVATPEPSALCLLIMGLLCIAISLRRTEA